MLHCLEELNTVKTILLRQNVTLMLHYTKVFNAEC